MKYSYQIIKKSTKEVIFDAHTEYDTEKEALEFGNARRKELALSGINHEVKPKPIPENVEEADALQGHYFPGHETWNDEATTLEEYNQEQLAQ